MPDNIGVLPQEISQSQGQPTQDQNGYEINTPIYQARPPVSVVYGNDVVPSTNYPLPPLPLPSDPSAPPQQSPPVPEEQPNYYSSKDHSTLTGSQNRQISSSVKLFTGDNVDAFTTAPQGQEDLFKRGLIDQNGNPTPKAVVGDQLIKKGMLNSDFTLNSNGLLFSAKQSDFFSPDNSEGSLNFTNTAEWMKDPSNQQRFTNWKKAKDLGLFSTDEEDKSLKDATVGFIGEMSDPAKLWNATKSVVKGAASFASNIGYLLTGPDYAAQMNGIDRTDEQKNQDRLKYSAAVYGLGEAIPETFIEKTSSLKHWVGRGISSLMADAGVISKDDKDIMDATGQFADASLKDALSKVNLLTTSLTTFGINAAANDLEQTQKQLPPTQFQKSTERGTGVGAFVGDPVNIIIGPVVGALGSGAKAAGGLFDAAVNANRISKVMEMTAAGAEADLNLTHAAGYATKAELAKSEIDRSTELFRKAMEDGNFEEAGIHGKNIAENQKILDESTRASTYHENIGAAIKESVNVMESNLPPTFQQRFMDAVKIPIAVPFKIVGGVVGKLGNGLEFVDDTITSLAKSFKLDQVRKFAQAASIVTGNIHWWDVAASVLQSHTIWKESGRLVKSIGEEMLTNQGTIPFFRRVAESMATPAGKVFARQLDNFIPPIARGFGAIAKGIGKAVVPSLIYETINQEGFTPDTARRGIADALVFGGGHGVYNAVTVGGGNDFIKTRIADRLNYDEKLKASNPDDHKLYTEKVSPDSKNVISSISGAYPNIEWKFTEEGPSYNLGNKIIYNVNKPESLASITLTHELSHALGNIHQANPAIASMMVGDQTRLGEIFNPDGTLTNEFSEFSNTYNSRMKAAGMPELNVHDMAVEMFTDKSAETLKSDIRSGEFTQAAQKSQLGRAIDGFSDALLNKTPILKNLHITLGGAIDSSGRMIMGSGLVSEGMRNSREVQALTRKMYQKSAGMPEFDINGRQTKGKVSPENAPSKQPRATKSTREGVNNARQAIIEANKKATDNGVPLGEGLDPSTKDGSFAVPNDYQTKAIINSGAIPPDHLGTFVNLVGAMNPDSTRTFIFKYRPAEQGNTPQVEGISYHNLKPFGTKVTKAGNITIECLDINKWNENVERVASSKQSKELGYTKQQILDDAYEASKYHIKDKSPDPYFENKYGADTAKQRKGLIAATYGEMSKAMGQLNPLIGETGGSRANRVYRSFSLEGIERVIQTNESTRLSFDPNNYYPLKINMMPEIPIVDREGNVVRNPASGDTRYMPKSTK